VKCVVPPMPGPERGRGGTRVADLARSTSGELIVATGSKQPLPKLIRGRDHSCVLQAGTVESGLLSRKPKRSLGAPGYFATKTQIPTRKISFERWIATGQTI
jgi:hypothetical protein